MTWSSMQKKKTDRLRLLRTSFTTMKNYGMAPRGGSTNVKKKKGAKKSPEQKKKKKDNTFEFVRVVGMQAILHKRPGVDENGHQKYYIQYWYLVRLANNEICKVKYDDLLGWEPHHQFLRDVEAAKEIEVFREGHPEPNDDRYIVGHVMMLVKPSSSEREILKVKYKYNDQEINSSADWTAERDCYSEHVEAYQEKFIWTNERFDRLAAKRRAKEEAAEEAKKKALSRKSRGK